jgi:hypothetical protein
VEEAFFGQSPSTDTHHKFVVTVSVPLIYTSSAKLTEQCIWIVEVIVLALHDFFPVLSYSALYLGQVVIGPNYQLALIRLQEGV